MNAEMQYNCAFFPVLTVPMRNCIYVVGPKKAWWILLPHAADLWNSECSLVCVFCLLCTWLIPRAVMASKWSVFNKQAWWTLPTCFMNWNSLVWTLARVEIPLTVWCWTAAFQLCYYPTVKHSVIKIAVWINSLERAGYLNGLRPSFLTVNPFRTCLQNVCSQAFIYIRWRWCRDSCTWRHLQQVKVGSRSAKKMINRTLRWRGGVEGYEKHGCSTVLHPRKQSSPVHNYNS